MKFGSGLAPSSRGQMLMFGFAGSFAILLMAHGGGAAQWLFPAASFALGVILYIRYPLQYIAFAWWLWFLTPLVRRIIDYQIGWNAISPVILAPYLVSALTVITFVRFFPLLRLKALFPFLLVLLGLMYAYLIGFVRAGPVAATYDLLNWATPVLFGFHVAAMWRRYPEYATVLTRTFRSGVLVMGVYGLIQHFLMPAWDAYWMQNAEISSIGLPYPNLVRVFSTMNSPSPFAVVLMAGLLLVFASPSAWPWFVAVPGYATFLLSLVRSAWLGWLAAVIFLLVKLPARQKGRLIGAGLASALLITPVLFIPPLAEMVGERFASFSNLEEDTSFTERSKFYGDFMLTAVANVGGEGMGATGISTKLSNRGALGQYGNFDSGIMDIMFSLGWPGAVLFCIGSLWLIVGIFKRTEFPPDLFASISIAICMGSALQLVFFNTLAGVAGMVFWCFLGMALAQQFYASSVAGPSSRRLPATGSSSITFGRQ